LNSKTTGRPLKRLRESYLPASNSQYTLLNESEVQSKQIRLPAKLTETYKKPSQDALLREVAKLKETCKDPGILNVLTKVAERLSEANNESRFKVWKLPIARRDHLNENGRSYPKKLWENVKTLQENAWKGLAGLSDHPIKDDDPGLFRDQAIVWHDMDVGDSSDDTVYGYGTFVGPYGHLGQEIIECGGRVGLSSSGFGDVDPRTKEVDPETFIIERLADLVLNPSQGVFGTVECDHGPEDFIRDPLKGAEIAFERPRAIQESLTPKSKIIKEKTKMAEVDAAKLAETEAKATAKAPSGYGKAEEKMFRKYIETFIAEANKIENPLHRLNECVDVLNLFDDGVAPDLKAKFQEQVLAEKKNLEALVENTTTIQKDIGVDVATLRDNAMKIAAAGMTLKEQVVDYEELCKELTTRIHKLDEENKKLKRGSFKKERLTERAITEKTRDLVGTQGKLDVAQARAKKLQEQTVAMKKTIDKLAAGNKQLEKKNGLLETKLREAAAIIKKGKSLREKVGGIANSAADENDKLRATIKELRESLKDMTGRRNFQVEQNQKLKEEFAAYKKKIEEDTNPDFHMMPFAEKRIGKFIDLRENQGRDIDEYWDDLCDRYGESVMKPFEQRIRGAKTLKEATARFLENRRSIDPDFQVGAPINDYPMRTVADRIRYLKEQGAQDAIFDATKVDVERLNEDFGRRMKAAGLR